MARLTYVNPHADRLMQELCTKSVCVHERNSGTVRLYNCGESIVFGYTDHDLNTSWAVIGFWDIGVNVLFQNGCNRDGHPNTWIVHWFEAPEDGDEFQWGVRDAFLAADGALDGYLSYLITTYGDPRIRQWHAVILKHDEGAR